VRNDPGKQRLCADMGPRPCDDRLALFVRQRATLARMPVNKDGRDAIRASAIIKQPGITIPVNRQVVLEREHGGDGDAAQIRFFHQVAHDG
jgi:hypothetical protein